MADHSVARNIHGVSKREWAKWTEQGRSLFNLLYGDMVKSPGIFYSANMRDNPPTKKDWKILAWNAAWYVAKSLKKP